MRYLLHHLLESSAERVPDRPAVIDRDRSVTYEELDRWGNRVANLLIGLGVSQGDRVAFYLDKSLESIVAIYGILKAGAAYIPLDPQAPPGRLAYILENAAVRHLITGSEKREKWPALLAEAPVDALIVLNARDAGQPDVKDGIEVLTAEDVAAAPDSSPGVAAIHLDLAYILYTSGSTGHPKGVMLSHLNALAFVDWTVDRFGISREDRLSSHAPLHFDLSIFDLFAAASAGAAVILVPQSTSFFPVELAHFIADSEITIWYSVPSILSMMVQRGGLSEGDFPQLKTLLFAGEVFPTKFLRELMRLLPHVRFFNLYGPTETNVCTYYEVPDLAEATDEPIPIGIPIDNVEVFAVSDEGRRALPGETGELYVRGSTVMHGYWSNLERTNKSLVADPFGGELHDPVYKTGDLVKMEPDGNYRLLGRRDHQIKSRGYRIELGDIESALYAHPDVVECAVVAVPDETITNRIRAFVVVKNGTDQGSLVRFCADRIPRYMIPEAFDFRPSLPKTSTGKIDRQALGR